MSVNRSLTVFWEIISKQVPLRERKRHTDRRVASPGGDRQTDG